VHQRDAEVGAVNQSACGVQLRHLADAKAIRQRRRWRNRSDTLRVAKSGEAAAVGDAMGLLGRGQVIIDEDPAGVWGIVVGDIFLDVSRHVIDTEGTAASRVHADRGC
jgi:hypothetical protein